MPREKKKILYITEMHPFLKESGGSLKTRYTLELLSKNYTLDVVCLTGDPQEEVLQQKHTNSIRLTAFYHPVVSGDFPQHKFLAPLSFLQGKPFYIYKFYSKKLNDHIESLDLSEYSAIHIDHISMIQYLPKKHSLPYIYEEHNIEHQLYATMAEQENSWKWKIPLSIETWLLKLYEKKHIPRFDLVLCISQDDEQTLQDFLQDKCPPTLTTPLPIKIRHKPNPAPRLLFLGSPDWKPNLQAIRWLSTEVMPVLQKNFPQIKLHVTGTISSSRSPHLMSIKHTVFHGYVEDLDQFLEPGGISLLPFFSGAGVRMKAITSVEYGLPILSTQLGVKGTLLEKDSSYFFAQTALEYINLLNSLIRNPLKSLSRSHQAQSTMQNLNQKNKSLFLQKYAQLLNNF